MPLDSSKAGQFGEVGVSGLTQFSGYVAEEHLSRLSYTKWRDELRIMLANDPVICSLNTVIEMLARQVSWKLAPADDSNAAAELRAFFEEALFNDTERTWQEHLSEIITFLQWGWSWHEIVYKRRGGDSRDPRLSSRFSDGRIGWRKFAGRSQDSLDRWKFSGDDDVTAMIQRGPNTGDEYVIPAAKSLHFRTTAAKNNPEGRSMYRGAYRPWYFKSRIENVEAIGIERDLAGLPVMYVPAEIMKNTASPAESALRNEMLDVVRKIRRDENEGVILPALHDKDGHRLFELTLLSTGGQRQFDTDKIIARYDQRILMTGLADFLLLGSQKVGSYALSTDKTSLFATALEAHLDSVCEKFNMQAIPELARLNGMNRDLLPKLEHGEVDRISFTELCEAVNRLSGAGITFDEDQQNWIKAQGKLPATQTTGEQ